MAIGEEASARETTELDPIDRAWIARRFAGAPLIYGLIAIATSLLMLGLLFGALGLRAGLDLWRTGTRRGIVAIGIAVSFAGIVASVVWAVVWGSILASVLLGRDAMREAERWRGTEMMELSTQGVEIVPPPEGVERTALLFIRVGWDPCAEAIRTAAAVAATVPNCRLILVDPTASTTAIRAFGLAHGAETAVIGGGFTFPPPLDGVAAFPTLVVIDRSGVIESALVGAHPASDLELVYNGALAKVESTPGQGR
jgi:hypothetical protein